MTRDEAKLVLAVCRPGGQDAANPELAEALAMLKTDPELAHWFAEQRDFDLAVSRALQSTAVPANLRTAILAGGKVIEQLSWWRLVNWGRVATCALVLGVGAIFFVTSLSRTQTLIAASREMIQFAEYRTANLTFKTSDLTKVRQFFHRCRAPAQFDLPPALSQLEILGGTLVGLLDQTAGVICFRHEDGAQVTLFVTRRVPDEQVPIGGEPQDFESGEWAAVIWSDRDVTYVLAGKLPPAMLRQMVGAQHGPPQGAPGT